MEFETFHSAHTPYSFNEELEQADAVCNTLCGFYQLYSYLKGLKGGGWGGGVNLQHE